MIKFQVGKPKSLKEIDKQYQFVKLCSSLTKQGFQFERLKSETHDTFSYYLVFSDVDFKRLHHPDTKTPYVYGTFMDTDLNTENRLLCAFIQSAEKK